MGGREGGRRRGRLSTDTRPAKPAATTAAGDGRGRAAGTPEAAARVPQALGVERRRPCGAPRSAPEGGELVLVGGRDVSRGAVLREGLVELWGQPGRVPFRVPVVVRVVEVVVPLPPRAALPSAA
eukprot:CAMPEP_0176316142 /NCGR_PEP_ID=MMETSP0121_2-20121125/68574_1 /TAXON_ID=160619 /ORGANISM="Kryptoperidinium foliaceum, Strain CCMP 1326" /LENGTH=124 /DNA_ID=CAMNT_0017658331 /DNA_START=89 /DNA_END=460 /DNA_ORIENTATION=-